MLPQCTRSVRIGFTTKGISRPGYSPMSQDTEKTCICLEGETYFENFERRFVGVDTAYGEVSVVRCKNCGRYWLNYLMEYEYLSRAGRWFRGVVAPEIASGVKPEEAKNILQNLEWYFRGGSAFGGKVTKTQGPLDLWLVPFSGPE